MGCKSFYSKIVILLMLTLCLSESCFAVLLDTEVITSGKIPSQIKFSMVKPNKAELRVIREYAPCLKLDLRGKGKWKLAFGSVVVKSGRRYTFAFTVASAGEALQSKTPDVANFRPENQPKKAESPEGKGYAVLNILGNDKLLASIYVSPTSWTKLTTAFVAPKGVNKITAELLGSGGGVFFIADMNVVAGSASPHVYVPLGLTFSQIQGGDQVEFKSLIKETKTYSLYRPGETVIWKVESPSDIAFKRFKYKIIDAYGKIYSRGECAFPADISYKPLHPGYYELVIRSISINNPDSQIHDRLGAAVLSEVSSFEAGGNPFGGQSTPNDLLRMLGGTWSRGGLTNWSDDVNLLDVNTDYSKNISDFKDNHIMPLHVSNNITSKSNSETIGDVNFLPTDFKAYGESYGKLAGLGNGFVKVFEFWNEPEGRIGVSPLWTPKNFTDAFVSAYKGLKAANPDARMAVGSNIELIKSVNAMGGQDSYDILILHPYPWAIGGPWNTPEDGALLETCISARKWLDSCGGKNKEIWSTEYGYTTGSTTGGCSELEQAQMDVRASLLQLAGGLNKINPFRMGDVYFWGQVDGRFGLCRGNLTPKPSFVSYGVLIRAVKNLPYRGRFNAGKNLAVLVFGDEKETTVAFWTDKGVKPLSLKTPGNSSHMDQFGRTMQLGTGIRRYTRSASVNYICVRQGYRKFVKAQNIPFIAGLSGGIFEGNTKRKKWSIPILSKAPVVNGKLDEWQGSAIKFDDPGRNFSSQVRVAISGDRFFVMASTRGESPGINPKDKNALWNGDCVELYFTPKPDDRCVGFYRDEDYHILIAPGIDGVMGKVTNGISGANPDIPDSNARYVRNPGGGYDIEASIPLDFFRIKNVKPGDRFGFDIQLGVASTKDDYPRRLQETWSGTGQNYMNPFGWGDAVAVKQVNRR